MSAIIISRSEKTFKVELEIPYCNSMLEGEEGVLKSLNNAGALATKEILQQFDSDGSNIEICGITFYPHGEREEKAFQTPYGQVAVERYVYQSSKGGKRFVPLDQDARIVGTSTPKFAKMVSSKYACDGAPGVQRDLMENHNRPVALSFIKNVSDLVGTIAIAKEESWSYEIPELPRAVRSISVGLDGTCLNMMEDGWREAMCGTISFFDKGGERLHTIYSAAAPEYGKKTFLKNFGCEVDKVIDLFPKTPVVGLADGAASNWKFLSEKADVLTVDFWHLSEYLAMAAEAMFPEKKNSQGRKEWMEDACHKAKNNFGGISRILKELEEFIDSRKMRPMNKERLNKVITYLRNHKSKMQYHKNLASNMPIGSGVTEAACKTIVKNRMCKGAARWKHDGATVILTIRSIHTTSQRWEQFWSKYSQYGFSKAA